MQHIIDKKLQDLACPVSLFVPITNGLVGRTRLTQALTGERTLDHNLVERLVALLNEMAELRRTSPVAPDWSDAAGIQNQLAARRAFRQAAEYDRDDMRELLLNANAESASQ